MNLYSSGDLREPKNPDILQAYTTTLHVDGAGPLNLLMITTELAMDPSHLAYSQDRLGAVLEVARLARKTGLFDSVAVCSIKSPPR